MATPVDDVIEAVEGLIGYEPPHARDLGETIEAYSRLGEMLRRAIMSLSDRVDENRLSSARTGINLADMATFAAGLYDKGNEAHNQFYDDQEFWLERKND